MFSPLCKPHGTVPLADTFCGMAVPTCLDCEKMYQKGIFLGILSEPPRGSAPVDTCQVAYNKLISGVRLTKIQLLTNADECFPQ